MCIHTWLDTLGTLGKKRLLEHWSVDMHTAWASGRLQELQVNSNQFFCHVKCTNHITIDEGWHIQSLYAPCKRGRCNYYLFSKM